MAGIITVSSGGLLTVKEGSRAVIGPRVFPIAWFAGDNSSSEAQSSSVYDFTTDAATSGPALGTFFQGSTGMHGNAAFAYAREGQDRRRYEYATGTLTNPGSSAQNMGTQGHCFGNDVNGYETSGASTGSFRRFPYATETEANIGVVWSGGANARNRSAASHANNTIAMVAAGGSPSRSDTQEFTFSSETTGSVVGGLSTTKMNVSAMGSTAEAFICGGQSGGVLNQIDNHIYASNTNAASGASLSVARDLACSASDAVSNNVGIVTTGNDGATLDILATDKINLTTKAVGTGTLLDVRRTANNSGTSNTHAGLVA